MKYSQFIQDTKHMKVSERSDYFNQLAEKERTELMDDYYQGAEKEEMFLQVRIIGAAEKIEEEQLKESPDQKKLENWFRLYDKLTEELISTRGR